MKDDRYVHLVNAFNAGLYWVELDGSVWAAPKKCGFHTRPATKNKVTRRSHEGSGYYLIVISVGNVRKYYPLHQVVWTFFNGRVQQGLEINHMDCNKTNNALYNLEVATRQGNAMHAYKAGRFLKERDSIGRIVR